MKTQILKKALVSVLTVLVLTSVSFAGEAKDKTKKKTKNRFEKLTEMVDSKINYPDMVISDNIEGAVAVEVTVNKDGKLNIDQIMASHPEFKEYVLTQLSTVTVDSKDESVGGSIIYRFTFLK